jgi:phosphoenolpyruvate carboxylase
MYENWLFFRTVIDNEQMVLIKADLMIAELYSELDDPKARSEIFGEFKSQYEPAVKRILEVTRQTGLLEKKFTAPTFNRSEKSLRGPYELHPSKIAQGETSHCCSRGIGRDDD